MAGSNGFDFDEYTKLGSILVRHKALTQRQLARAIAHQGGQSIGDTVVDMGLCTRDEVDAAEIEQHTARGTATAAVTVQATATMRAAMSKVSDQLGRLKQATSTRIELPISPGKV